MGSYVNGSPTLSTYHWNSCQVAHLREDASEASRPNLGRRPNPPVVQTNMADDALGGGKSIPETPVGKTNDQQADRKPAKIQTRLTPIQKPPNPNGPVITQQMFEAANWPEILQIPSEPSQIPSGNRPVRSTRNKNPQYIDCVDYISTCYDNYWVALQVALLQTIYLIILPHIVYYVYFTHL